MSKIRAFIFVSLAFLLWPAAASAQCNGQFPANSVCGTTSAGLPKATAFSALGRLQQTSTLNYYVNGNSGSTATCGPAGASTCAAGSDSNTCLTPSTACLTLQRVINIISSTIDVAGQNPPNIYLAHNAGTQNYAATCTKGPFLGTSVVNVIGDSASATATVIHPTPSGYGIQIKDGCTLDYSYVQFSDNATNNGSGHILVGASGNAGHLDIHNVTFGSMTLGTMMTAGYMGSITATGPITISGGAPAALTASNGGVIDFGSQTVTVSGTPAFSTAFAFLINAGVINATSSTFSGSATGTRCQINGPVNVSGYRPDAVFPGNANCAISEFANVLGPSIDSTTAFKITKADLATAIVTVDSTNKRVGINKTPGAFDLDVNGAANFASTAAIATSLAVPIIGPASDSTTAIKITKADLSTAILTVDTTNKRVGINKTPGAFDLDVNGAVNHASTTTLAGALTYGGVTLANAVTGTGNMVLSAAPTLTGNINLGGGATNYVNIGNNTAAPSPSGTLVYVVGNTTGVPSTALGAAFLNGFGLVLADTTAGGYGVVTFGAAANNAFFRANGTNGALTALAANDIIGAVAGGGYQTTTGAWAGGKARILLYSAEAWTSTAQGTYISFETTISTTTTRAEAVRIQNSGGVTIGNSATDPGTGGLYVGGATITLNALATDATHTDRTVCQDTTSKSLFFGSGAAGICLGTSSAAFKHDIHALRAGLAEIMRLEAVSYKLNKDHGDPDKVLYGFTAEQAINVLPDLVGRDAKGKPLTVDYMGVVPVLVHAIQQLKADNDNLRMEIKKLAGRKK